MGQRTFVDNIPVRALLSVPPRHLSDVVLHDTDQCGAVGDLADPGWQLAVPDQRVASQLLAVLRRKVCNGVSSSPGELVLGRFSGFPLFSGKLFMVIVIGIRRFLPTFMAFSGVTEPKSAPRMMLCSVLSLRIVSAVPM